MAISFSDDTLRQIRDRARLEDVASRHLSLVRKGGALWACCPFHQEKTPSFKISSEYNAYKCFGCGESGDVIKFVQKVEGLSFPEAVASLARQAGVEIRETAARPGDKDRALKRDRLFAINQAALLWFRGQFITPAGKPAREYMAGRGYSADQLDHWQIGFAGDEWTGLAEALRREKHNLAEAAELGLIAPRKNGDGYYDRFRGRIMFPIRDIHGGVIGFGGRVFRGEDKDETNPTGKYFNSTDSVLYSKSRVLFGQYEGRRAIAREQAVIVAEGYLDVMRLHQHGFEHAVAACGTALTPAHLELLKRRVKTVYFLFDGDNAGRAAAVKAARLALASGVEARCVEMPPGDDPDSFLPKSGAGALKQRLDEALPGFDLILKDAASGDLETVEARVRAFRGLKPLLDSIPDVLTRQLYIRQAAQVLRMPEEEAARGAAVQRESAAPAGAPLQRVPAKRLEGPEWAELEIAELLLKYPSLIREVLEAMILPEFRVESLRLLCERILELDEMGEQFHPADIASECEDDALRALLIDRLMDSRRHEGSDRVLAIRDAITGHRLNTIMAMKKQCDLALISAVEAGNEEEIARIQAEKVQIDRIYMELSARRHNRPPKPPPEIPAPAPAEVV